MDYNKINKIDTDGDNNIVIQDVNGSTITVNYNDSDAIAGIIEKISDKQILELKQIIGSQNKAVIEEIRKLQEKIDEQNVNQQSKEVTKDLDDFFKELAEMKTEGIKKRLMTNYKLLREFEELLIFEEDPRRKMRYEKDVEDIKGKIETATNELKNKK